MATGIVEVSRKSKVAASGHLTMDAMNGYASSVTARDSVTATVTNDVRVERLKEPTTRLKHSTIIICSQSQSSMTKQAITRVQG